MGDPNEKDKLELEFLMELRQKEEALQETADTFRQLLIYTGDETENLYNAFSEMTDENLEYLKDIQKKNLMINQMQDALILVLADMVESRDKNTGDHVKKSDLPV